MSDKNNSSKQNKGSKIVKIDDFTTTKSYNMNSKNGAPKNRQQLNDVTKFVNLKDLDLDERILYLGRQVYLWSMFDQNAKSVLITSIDNDTIFYEIKGKIISEETTHKYGFSASYTHVNDKCLSLGVNIAGGCFYGKILSQEDRNEIEKNIRDKQKSDKEREENFHKLLNNTDRQVEEKLKIAKKSGKIDEETGLNENQKITYKGPGIFRCVISDQETGKILNGWDRNMKTGVSTNF